MVNIMTVVDPRVEFLKNHNPNFIDVHTSNTYSLVELALYWDISYEKLQLIGLLKVHEYFWQGSRKYRKLSQ